MATKKRGGRVTPKGTRPPDRRQSHRDDGTPDIVRDVEDACRQPSPLALMSMASTLIEGMADRPLNRLRNDDEDPIDFGELIGSFVFSGFPVMSVLGRAMVLLHPDRVLADAAAAALPDADLRPRWAASMDDVEFTGAAVHSEPLDDGHNVVVSFRWPTGGDVSIVVYVDHNMGSLAKDAFIVPASMDDVTAMVTGAGDDDLTSTTIDLADARARIAGAIEHFERSWPPIETDTWPGCRPLVDWLLTKLPEGGTGYERPEVSQPERDAALDGFIAEYGESVDGLAADDVRSLASGLVDFAVDHGPGDPLRWSAISVEIVLAEWYARKIFGIHDELMRRLPDVLEAFVRHAHAVRGIPARLTDDTLAAVLGWTPEYLEALDQPRSPDASADRLAQMLAEASGEESPEVDADDVGPINPDQ